MSSVQFRSRIKPAFNYTPTLNSYGVCCNSTGSGSVVKSFTECFNEGGHFIPVLDGNYNNVKCPDSDTRLGCCCSCSYVLPADIDLVSSTYFNSGTRSNVSRCECDRLGGLWSEGSCPDLNSENLNRICGSPDVRMPKSCCHLAFDDNTGWPTGVSCANVCTSVDCAELGTQVYPSIFGTSPCNSTNCATSEYYSFMTTRSGLYDQFEMGSCYTLEDVNGNLEYTCSIVPKGLCDNGYWVTGLNEENVYCANSYQPDNPQKILGKYQPQTMTLAEFNAIGLTEGDEFQGGRYIGIFETPLSGVGSEVYGSINFSDPVLSNFTSDTIGGTASRWALIVDETNYKVSFLLEDETDINFETSLWDGHYNTYGNLTSFQGIQSALTNSIRYQNRSGFIDYYLPSIYELFFYSAYLQKNNITTIGNLMTSSIFNTKYLNNGTNQYVIGNKSYIYGQSIDSLNVVNYKTILIEKYVQQNIRFFRKIILT